MDRLAAKCPHLTKLVEIMHSEDDTPQLLSAMFDPALIDPLSREIRLVYQCCSEPEGSLSEPERNQQSEFLLTIGLLESEWVAAVEGGKCEPAGLKLFHQTIYTPQNLNALCMMCNGKIRTGDVRCQAATTLCDIIYEVSFVWDIKMMDGNSFAFRAAMAFANVLDPVFRESQYHDDICDCISIPTYGCFMASLMRCSDPSKIIKKLAQYDWKGIFEHEPFLLEMKREKKIPVVLRALVVEMYDFSAKALKLDRNDKGARQVLKKIASCDKLFRGILRLVASGGLLSPVGAVEQETLLMCCGLLPCFFNCLVPLPNDREFQVLVQVAEAKYLEISTLLEGNPSMQYIYERAQNGAIFLAYQADRILETESDEDRWERFAYQSLRNTKDAKTTNKEAKKRMKTCFSTPRTKEEMCANCNQLESELDQKLFCKCARCEQVHYCR